MSRISTTNRHLILIASAILLIAFLGMLGYLKYFSETPTCSDNKQNGDEVGIDCGGGCRLVCTVQASPIVLKWQRPFQTLNDVYNVVAQLENVNPDLGIRELVYDVKIYDQDNVLIVGPIQRTTTIGPNQNHVLFIGPLETSKSREPARVFFKLAGSSGWEHVDTFFAKAPIVVRRQNFVNSPNGAALDIELENTTQRQVYDIEVIVLLYDATGNVVGVSRTEIDMMNPNTTDVSTLTWPMPFDEGEVAKIVVQPQINVFHEQNDRL
ncbi:MAG: hypothetical protein OEX08_02100 [Candidatus Nomurabacteria bacterium]|nr:hypothetical protein [Candidatus Nomurabacteria bacterium]